MRTSPRRWRATPPHQARGPPSERRAPQGEGAGGEIIQSASGQRAASLSRRPTSIWRLASQSAAGSLSASPVRRG